MSVIVIINLSAKDESVEELKKFLKENLPDTRSFEGCQGVQLYSSIESPSTLALPETWESEEAHKKYRSWRRETGAEDKLGSMLTEPLVMQFYDIVDE